MPPHTVGYGPFFRVLVVDRDHRDWGRRSHPALSVDAESGYRKADDQQGCECCDHGIVCHAMRFGNVADNDRAGAVNFGLEETRGETTTSDAGSSRFRR